jgi:hypothetical protein
MHFPTGRVAFASPDGLTAVFPGWQKPVPEWWFLHSFATVFSSSRGCSESTRLTLLHGEHKPRINIAGQLGSDVGCCMNGVVTIESEIKETAQIPTAASTPQFAW